MKANELMIGDWVKIKTYGVSDKYERTVAYIYVKIAEIGSGLITVEYNNDIKEPYRICENTEIEPIPLTPEILEKNGWRREFDKIEYMVKYDLRNEGKNCWMMWAIKEHNLDVQRQDEKLDIYNLKVSRVDIPCDYVHELQHALRLCGIDKEIVV